MVRANCWNQRLHIRDRVSYLKKKITEIKNFYVFFFIGTTRNWSLVATVKGRCLINWATGEFLWNTYIRADEKSPKRCHHSHLTWSFLFWHSPKTVFKMWIFSSFTTNWFWLTNGQKEGEAIKWTCFGHTRFALDIYIYISQRYAASGHFFRRKCYS